MKKSHRSMSCLALALFGLTLLFASTAAAVTAGPIRIVVVPFYSEDGADAKDGDEATGHYRRMMRFVNNRLVERDFEVVNPFAADAADRELDRIQQIAREDSVRAVLDVTRRYGVDAAYLVWLKVKVNRTGDGYCKASARADGEGYDSAGHDLGAGLSKAFNISRRTCDDAVAEVEKEVGDLLGRILTEGGRPIRNGGGDTAEVVVPAEPVANDKGVLVNSIDGYSNLITVHLAQATDYAVAEVFGKVVNTVRGVVDATLFSQRIVADTPQACFVTWRLTIDEKETEPFRLQANIMKMIEEVAAAGGDLTLKGVRYHYTADEIRLLKGIRPDDATTREIRFVVDRDQARQRDMAGN